MRGPQRLGVRHRSQRAEARDVVGMDHLDVREVVAIVAPGRSRRSCLDGVQRLAHGPVADRVEVHLEPESRRVSVT